MRERFRRYPTPRWPAAAIAVTPLLPKVTAAVLRDGREQGLAVTISRVPAEAQS